MHDSVSPTYFVLLGSGSGGVNFFLERGGIRDGCWSQKPAQVGMNELSGTDRIAMECPAEIMEDQQLGTDWQPREAEHVTTVELQLEAGQTAKQAAPSSQRLHPRGYGRGGR